MIEGRPDERDDGEDVDFSPADMIVPWTLMIGIAFGRATRTYWPKSGVRCTSSRRGSRFVCQAHLRSGHWLLGNEMTAAVSFLMSQ